MEEDEGAWLPLAEAAARTGVTVDALRHKVRARDVDARKDNAGRWLVRLPSASAPSAEGEIVAGLRAQLASERLAVERWRTEAEAARVDAARSAGELLALRERAASDRALIEWYVRSPWWRRLLGR